MATLAASLVASLTVSLAASSTWLTDVGVVDTSLTAFSISCTSGDAEGSELALINSIGCTPSTLSLIAFSW